MHMTLVLQRTSGIEDPDFQATLSNVAGRLTRTSCKTYVSDFKYIAFWMIDRDLTLQSLSRNNLVVYHAQLKEVYAKATASVQGMYHVR